MQRNRAVGAIQHLLGGDGRGFSKLKSQYALFVDALGSKQVFQYVYHMRLCITVSIVTDNIVYVVSF